MQTVKDDKEDIEKAGHIKPVLTGINSRDLTSFRVDLTIPLTIKQMITWKTNLIFESGIHFQENALLALSSGFRGILVGEAVVRDPSLIRRLLEGCRFTTVRASASGSRQISLSTIRR